MDINTSVNTKKTPKDFFMHLLAIITLYLSVGFFIALIFQYINLYFPNPLSYMSRESAESIIRRAISFLIITFPMYVIISYYINKDYKLNSWKLDLRVRRWLIYFTLFVAALMLMGDLIVLVNSLLEGELTARFILKVLTMFVVIGTVFLYYFKDIKRS